jgi:Ca2+:H+ antiporter
MFGLPRARTIAALVLIPASIAAKVAGAEVATFALSGAAVIPLAGVLGQATEELAIHAGPRACATPRASGGSRSHEIAVMLGLPRGRTIAALVLIPASIVAKVAGAEVATFVL